MRVLMTIAEMGSGGAEAVVEELARALPACGVTVDVASAGGRRETALRELGAGVHRVPIAGRSPAGILRAAAGLRRAARSGRPDLLHAHNVGATLTTHVGIRGLRRTLPLLTTFHGVAAQDYPAAARVLDRCADAVVVVAPEIGERLTAAGLSRTPVHVLPNAVTPPAAHDRADVRRELGLDADGAVVLCAARLVPQKRHDLLLTAFAQLPGEPVLLLAGDGALRPALEDQINTLGLAGRVRLLGERRDVDRLLAAADVFALASDWEGLPMALLEALAAGLPLIVTDVDGVKGAVGTDAATVVPPGDPTALAAALGSVLADPQARRRMAAAGRLRSAERYSPRALADGYAALYAALTGPDSAISDPDATAGRSVAS